MNERTFETYRFYDPEIVRWVDGEIAGQYATERDASILNLPPEAKPVVFKCRLLSRPQRNRINEVSAPKTQLMMAFRYGLVEIRDIPRDDGTTFSWTPRRSKEAGQIDDKAIDELDDMGFGDTDLWEIGGVVVAQSFLAKGAPVYCPQLPSSQLAWVAVCSRFLAEQKTGSETPPGA